MPTRAPRNCTRSGCKGLVREGICSQCGSRSGADKRASAAKRGYGGTWRRVRRMVLNEQPLCVECQRNGRVTIATDVHHVTPLRDGGENAADNLEPLCHSCHSRVTARGG